MAWVAPPVFTSGAALTAAQLNILGGDLNETGPAKFTTAGQIFVATGSNAGAARTITSANYNGGGTDATNSTSFIALTGGPTVSPTTGSSALVHHSSFISNDTTGSRSYAGYAVSGATTIAADEVWAIYMDMSSAGRGVKCGLVYKHNGLTPGTNTFTGQYRVTGNTGTFTNRGIIVIPL